MFFLSLSLSFCRCRFRLLSLSFPINVFSHLFPSFFLSLSITFEVNSMQFLINCANQRENCNGPLVKVNILDHTLALSRTGHIEENKRRKKSQCEMQRLGVQLSHHFIDISLCFPDTSEWVLGINQNSNLSMNSPFKFTSTFCTPLSSIRWWWR